MRAYMHTIYLFSRRKHAAARTHATYKLAHATISHCQTRCANAAERAIHATKILGNIIMNNCCCCCCCRHTTSSAVFFAYLFVSRHVRALVCCVCVCARAFVFDDDVASQRQRRHTLCSSATARVLFGCAVFDSCVNVMLTQTRASHTRRNILSWRSRDEHI